MRRIHLLEPDDFNAHRCASGIRWILVGLLLLIILPPLTIWILVIGLIHLMPWNLRARILLVLTPVLAILIASHYFDWTILPSMATDGIAAWMAFVLGFGLYLGQFPMLVRDFARLLGDGPLAKKALWSSCLLTFLPSVLLSGGWLEDNLPEYLSGVLLFLGMWGILIAAYALTGNVLEEGRALCKEAALGKFVADYAVRREGEGLRHMPSFPEAPEEPTEEKFL